LFPYVFHRLPLQKDADQKLYLAQLTRGLLGVGETEETCLLGQSWGGSTVATPTMSLPCFPINTGETKRQGWRRRKKVQSRKRREREQKKGGRGERKKKKQREEERRNKNEKKNKEKGRRAKQRRSCHQHRCYLEPLPPLAITDNRGFSR